MKYQLSVYLVTILILKCHIAYFNVFCFNLKEHDEPILKHLKDIKVKFSDAGQPMVKEL